MAFFPKWNSHAGNWLPWFRGFSEIPQLRGGKGWGGAVGLGFGFVLARLQAVAVMLPIQSLAINPRSLSRHHFGHCYGKPPG